MDGVRSIEVLVMTISRDVIHDVESAHPKIQYLHYCCCIVLLYAEGDEKTEKISYIPL